MQRKIVKYKKFIVSISSIAVLYFVVVNVIGDTTGDFNRAPAFDPTQDNGPESAPGIDGVRNASLISAVLFPDGTTLQRPIQHQIEIPDPEQFNMFVPLDAGNAQYLASNPPGFNLFASLGPQSNISPQTVPALAHQGGYPGFFGDRGGLPGIPGGSYIPPATNAGGPAPLPASSSRKTTEPNKGFVPAQVASSQNPPARTDNAQDDNVEHGDTTPGVSQKILPIRSPSPVPEPASLLLLLLGMGALQLRRRAA